LELHILKDKAPSTRRLGLKTSATRAALINAAAQVLQEEGANALTSRRVAEKAGLKQQLVHYYFRTMDDLIAALVHRSGDEVLKRAVRAATADEPMRALWAMATDRNAVLLTMEMAAIASHSEVIRAETMRYAEQFRTIAAEAIARYLELRGIAPRLPPIAVTMILTAVGGMLMREKILGMSTGHAELEKLIEDWLEIFVADGEPGRLWRFPDKPSAAIRALRAASSAPKKRQRR
jgi:TetR/AcrR family transcriptional regulator